MKSSAPPILVTKTKGKLVPETALDEELLETHPNGTLFVVRPEARRSGRLHRTYWKALTNVIEATNIRPNADSLHEDLMWDLGYFKIATDFNGKPRLERDSIAFSNWPSDRQFKPYFDQAMARLAELTGIDPLAFLGESRTDPRSKP